MTPLHPSPLKRVCNATPDDTDPESTSPTKRQRRFEIPDTAGADMKESEKRESTAEKTVTSEKVHDQEDMNLDKTQLAPTHENSDTFDWLTVWEPAKDIDSNNQPATESSIPQGDSGLESKKERSATPDPETQPKVVLPPTPRMQERQLAQLRPLPRPMVRPPPGFESIMPATQEEHARDESLSVSSSSSDFLSTQNDSPSEQKPEQQTLLGAGRNWKDAWFYSMFCQFKIYARLVEMQSEEKEKNTIQGKHGDMKGGLQLDGEKSADHAA